MAASRHLVPAIVTAICLAQLSVYAQTASFQYPTGGETFNFVDTVRVVYTTNYPSTNITLFCYVGPNDYSVYDIPQNPFSSSGTYDLSNIGTEGKVTQYPVLCHLKLTDAVNSSIGNSGSDWSLVSTAGPATTRSASATTATSSLLSTTSAASNTNTGTAKSAAPSQTSSGGSSTPSPSSSTSSGLSTGAQAGIGVGATLAGLLLIGVCLLLFRTRRRLRRAETGVAAQDQAAPPYSHQAVKAMPPSEMYQSDSSWPVKQHTEPQELGGSNEEPHPRVYEMPGP